MASVRPRAESRRCEALLGHSARGLCGNISSSKLLSEFEGVEDWHECR